MTPEKRVQNKIVDYLHALEDEGFPIFVERRNAGGFSYKKGIPDLYAVINGQHVEIEVKRESVESSRQCNWSSEIYAKSEKLLGYAQKALMMSKS